MFIEACLIASGLQAGSVLYKKVRKRYLHKKEQPREHEASSGNDKDRSVKYPIKSFSASSVIGKYQKIYGQVLKKGKWAPLGRNMRSLQLEEVSSDDSKREMDMAMKKARQDIGISLATLGGVVTRPSCPS